MRLAISLFLFTSVSLASKPLQLPRPPQAPPVQLWESPVQFPKGMVSYKPTKYTQSIYVLNGRDTIDKVPISGIDSKWHQSGGMEGISGWKSKKFKLIPDNVSTWVAGIEIWNGFNYQTNRGIVREYPDGTRFDDILINSETKEVFEHRSRQKKGGQWRSRTLFTNDKARPEGYNGLTVTCASCHRESGSGGYATGLVPGGDGVLSHELDWSVASNIGGRR